MTPERANLLNSLVLIIFGLWGYFEVMSPTALIPVGFGVVLLCCFLIISAKPSLTKLVAHIAVLLTLIILIALVGVRLPKSLASGGPGLFRVISMSITSTIALVYFIKNFIDMKKAKKNS